MIIFCLQQDYFTLMQDLKFCRHRNLCLYMDIVFHFVAIVLGISNLMGVLFYVKAGNSCETLFLCVSDRFGKKFKEFEYVFDK